MIKVLSSGAFKGAALGAVVGAGASFIKFKLGEAAKQKGDGFHGIEAPHLEKRHEVAHVVRDIGTWAPEAVYKVLVLNMDKLAALEEDTEQGKESTWQSLPDASKYALNVENAITNLQASQPGSTADFEENSAAIDKCVKNWKFNIQQSMAERITRSTLHK